jgi:hypothetical protein
MQSFFIMIPLKKRETGKNEIDPYLSNTCDEHPFCKHSMARFRFYYWQTMKISYDLASCLRYD